MIPGASAIVIDHGNVARVRSITADIGVNGLPSPAQAPVAKTCDLAQTVIDLGLRFSTRTKVDRSGPDEIALINEKTNIPEEHAWTVDFT